jgi:hypothetical protein
MLKQVKLSLEKALKFLQNYLLALEPMTPTFALHSSTTKLLNLCLGDTAELKYK